MGSSSTSENIRFFLSQKRFYFFDKLSLCLAADKFYFFKIKLLDLSVTPAGKLLSDYQIIWMMPVILKVD